MSQPQRVEITTTSILKVFGVVLGLFFLWFIRDILALLFVTAIIVAALGPTVRTLESYGIPRAGGVLLIYLGAFIVVAGLVSLIVPPLITQLVEFAETSPAIVRQITPLYQLFPASSIQQVINTLNSALGSFTQGIFAATAQIFGGAVSAITVLVLSFYMLVDAQKTREHLIVLVPSRYARSVSEIVSRTGEKLGSWLRGQLLLSVIIGTITFIGLTIIQVPFALTLGVTAGLLEIIPLIGPTIAAVIAVLVAYAASSWQVALAVLIFFIVLQQAENHILVPKVMQSAVGLSPIIVIIALAIGGRLAGMTGAILAVPLAATISVLIQELPRLRHRQS